MKLYSRLALFALLTVIFLTFWVLSQTTGRGEERKVQISQKIEENEFEKDANRIESLSASRDFQGLLQLSEALKEKWGNNIKAYSFLQAEISKSFASYDFQNKMQYFYSVELSKDVLKYSDQIPIELEYEMVSKLQSRSAYLWGLKVEENWEKDRRDRVNQLFHLWNRLEKTIDPNFDFNDVNNRPKGNVPVPAPNYIPGITPESIKDPKIRRKYEKAIEINKQKAFKYNEQIIRPYAE